MHIASVGFDSIDFYHSHGICNGLAVDVDMVASRGEAGNGVRVFSEFVSEGFWLLVTVENGMDSKG